jgi:NAD(P)-dependent dehydrogenase (short-subunit alcohol dehydrogenase family)
VACCRTPELATDLQDLVRSLVPTSKHRIQIVPLDLEQQSSIEHAGTAIRGRFERVDLLLNVAGILGDGTTTPGPERTLSKMDRSWLEQTMAVNLIGPVMLSKELLPLILQQPPRRGRNKNLSEVDTNTFDAHLPVQRPRAVVANLSARVGSISDNGLGGWYSYRMSKAALNQATRTMALEFKRYGAWTVALHPGTTDTKLSQPFHKNVKEGSLFPVDFTVTQLLNLIDSLQEENSGGFYDWSGRAISF